MTTIEMNQKIQSLYTHTQKKHINVRERCVTIKRIIQMLKLLKD